MVEDTVDTDEENIDADPSPPKEQRFKRLKKKAHKTQVIDLLADSPPQDIDAEMSKIQFKYFSHDAELESPPTDLVQNQASVTHIEEQAKTPENPKTAQDDTNPASTSPTQDEKINIINQTSPPTQHIDTSAPADNLHQSPVTNQGNQSGKQPTPPPSSSIPASETNAAQFTYLNATESGRLIIASAQSLLQELNPPQADAARSSNTESSQLPGITQLLNELRGLKDLVSVMTTIQTQQPRQDQITKLTELVLTMVNHLNSLEGKIQQPSEVNPRYATFTELQGYFAKLTAELTKSSAPGNAEFATSAELQECFTKLNAELTSTRDLVSSSSQCTIDQLSEAVNLLNINKAQMDVDPVSNSQLLSFSQAIMKAMRINNAQRIFYDSALLKMYHQSFGQLTSSLTWLSKSHECLLSMISSSLRVPRHVQDDSVPIIDGLRESTKRLQRYSTHLSSHARTDTFIYKPDDGKTGENSQEGTQSHRGTQLPGNALGSKDKGKGVYQAAEKKKN
ncbi:uncharacterized protein [Euphorbia lathyris]|uniref:uncharacterized protein n=1 Tax=Euphorbia lathyris TaxID=212925 RepID=UPI003313A63E